MERRSHFVAVAQRFLREIYPELDDVDRSPADARRARTTHSTLSLDSDNVLERDESRLSADPLPGAPSAYGGKLTMNRWKLRGSSRRTRLQSCNSGDYVIALFNPLSNALCSEQPSSSAWRLHKAIESGALIGKRFGISLNGLPVALCSVLSYNTVIELKRHQTLSRTSECMETGGLRPFFDGACAQSGPDWTEKNCISFANSLSPSSFFSRKFPASLDDQTELVGGNIDRGSFDLGALLLDDTEFRPSGRKTTLVFPSYMVSVIDYADPAILKRESNEKFRRKFPDVQLTYSKYLSIKREMKEIAGRLHIETSILAQSVSYFDQCLLRAFIDKCNRKHIAGVCLILAAKLNDIKGPKLKKLIEAVGEQFRLLRVELLRYELPVAVGLDFALHLPTVCIAAHFQKLTAEC